MNVANSEKRTMGLYFFVSLVLMVIPLIFDGGLLWIIGAIGIVLLFLSICGMIGYGCSLPIILDAYKMYKLPTNGVAGVAIASVAINAVSVLTPIFGAEAINHFFSMFGVGGAGLFSYIDVLGILNKLKVFDSRFALLYTFFIILLIFVCLASLMLLVISFAMLFIHQNGISKEIIKLVAFISIALGLLIQVVAPVFTKFALEGEMFFLEAKISIIGIACFLVNIALFILTLIFDFEI